MSVHADQGWTPCGRLRFAVESLPLRHFEDIEWGGLNSAGPLLVQSTGRMLRTLDGYTHGIHSHWVTGLEFSPDGRQLASCGGDLVLKIWELSSGRGITRRG